MQREAYLIDHYIYLMVKQAIQMLIFSLKVKFIWEEQLKIYLIKVQ